MSIFDISCRRDENGDGKPLGYYSLIYGEVAEGCHFDALCNPLQALNDNTISLGGGRVIAPAQI